MSLNTLETAYANGQIIDASHINELTLSMLGALVGRDAGGVPTPLQSLGTLAVPWGNLYANGIILDGQAVDTSQIVSLANRIVSSKSRPLSSQPDFLRASGSALEFTILGTDVDLVLSINTQAVSVATDLVKSGITAAASANNTAQVNNTNILNDLYAGEIDAAVTSILIDNVGSEFTSKVGQKIAFQTPTGEISQGFLKSAIEITNVYRGYYFDDSGNPSVRGFLSNNDSITLLNLGFVFLEDNGTTVDVTYRTPSISYNAPNSPQTGDYWFDISNQAWKRYSGTTFEIINRHLIGEIVSNDTAVIATRSYDYSRQYEQDNEIEIDLFSSEILKSQSEKAKVSVYGKELQIDQTPLSWNITVDLENGQVEETSQDYFLYLDEDGQETLSKTKPYQRKDLKGHYHPHNSWRCVGVCFNDSSDDISLASSYEKNTERAKLLGTKPEDEFGGSSSTSFITREITVIESTDNICSIDSNILTVLKGEYDINSFSQCYVAGGSYDGHRTRLYDVDAVEVLRNKFFKEIHSMSTAGSAGAQDGQSAKAIIEEVVKLDRTTRFELQTIATVTSAGGLGRPSNTTGVDEIYMTMNVKRIGV